MKDSQLNSWVEISRSALLNNVTKFKRKVLKDSKFMAVVKSNAYGHGMIEVARIIQSKVDWFGVANLDEAFRLREVNIRKPILVLSYYFLNRKDIEKAIKWNISLVIFRIDQLKFIRKEARRLKKKVKVHLKVDVGTSRIGFLKKDLDRVIKLLIASPEIDVEGVMSHFSSSEESKSLTEAQLTRFEIYIEKLCKHGIEPSIKHIACSAASLVNNRTHGDIARVGISLYGIWPSEKVKKNQTTIELKPALTWKTKIIQIKEVPKGTKISYGGTYITKRNTKIGILPVGYWEGVRRLRSNKGYVLVKDKRALILGRVCMNLFMVDLTATNDVKVNDEVVLIGKQGKEEIRAEEIAMEEKSINYEVVTEINPLLPRIITK